MSNSPCLIPEIDTVKSFVETFRIYLLEKAMAPQSSTFAWKIPWMEGPGRLKPMESLEVGHD